MPKLLQNTPPFREIRLQAGIKTIHEAADKMTALTGVEISQDQVNQWELRGTRDAFNIQAMALAYGKSTDEVIQAARKYRE